MNGVRSQDGGNTGWDAEQGTMQNFWGSHMFYLILRVLVTRGWSVFEVRQPMH